MTIEYNQNDEPVTIDPAHPPYLKEDAQVPSLGGESSNSGVNFLSSYGLQWRQTVALERAAVAQETSAEQLTKIAGHVENIDNNIAKIQADIAKIQSDIALIQDDIAIIRAKVVLIEQHQDCLCRCCKNGSERGELLIETNMQHPDKTAPERHDLYEEVLQQAGQTNYGDE